MAVDIHFHLLRGIDDGSPHVDDSISYIKRLRRLGLSKFICTPHKFPSCYPNTAETISNCVTDFKRWADRYRCNVEIAAAAHLCLPDIHMLIEMRCDFETPNIRQSIFDLQTPGYTVTLAHS